MKDPPPPHTIQKLNTIEQYTLDAHKIKNEAIESLGIEKRKSVGKKHLDP